MQPGGGALHGGVDWGDRGDVAEVTVIWWCVGCRALGRGVVDGRVGGQL